MTEGHAGLKEFTMNHNLSQIRQHNRALFATDAMYNHEINLRWGTAVAWKITDYGIQKNILTIFRFGIINDRC